MKLSGDDVRYYTLNASGEIDRMVLHEVTGDTQTYVYVSGIEDNSTEMNISVNYTYIQDGQVQHIKKSRKNRENTEEKYSGAHWGILRGEPLTWPTPQ